MTTFDEWLTELEGQLRGLVVEAGGRVETDAPHLKALVARVRELDARLDTWRSGAVRIDISLGPPEQGWPQFAHCRPGLHVDYYDDAEHAEHAELERLKGEKPYAQPRNNSE